ncbi:MAG: endonuclease/exonuclease/phosphatase family protein [Candidatus Hinthialibacter antarcticus]|nr:endonuclease/exonuclease/phosphatase family protein [Candidatus Hinthialibacter antarcticus]
MRSLLIALAIALFVCTPGYAQDEINVMTFNIRYDNRDDPNPWPDRKGEVASIINRADLIGLQEALKTQIDDLTERLPDHAWFGVGRDDGKAKGEYTCIFYRKDRFTLNGSGTFWLSETPDVPGSMSWDTSLTRICTWGKFTDKKSKKTFMMFNTHFDHRGRQARDESAKLIARMGVQLSDGAPSILTGDFNSREDSNAYKTLVELFYDARYYTGKPPVGPHATFTNWKEVGQGSPIDYIFILKENSQALQPVNHVVVDEMFRGFYPSDHLPVMATIELK